MKHKCLITGNVTKIVQHLFPPRSLSFCSTHSYSTWVLEVGGIRVEGEHTRTGSADNNRFCQNLMATIYFPYILGVWRKPTSCQRRKEGTCLASRPWMIVGQLNLNIFLGLCIFSEFSGVSKKMSPTIIT